MIELQPLPDDVRKRLDHLSEIARQAGQRAIEENRRLGIPNVYEIDGKIYYELPNGELSLTDPWVQPVETPNPAVASSLFPVQQHPTPAGGTTAP